jgi:hypothetical protein
MTNRSFDSTASNDAPTTPTEKALVDIWSGILKLDRVGVHEDFLDLGGHSLSATLCINRIKEMFSVEVPLDAFFLEPAHIAAMASLVDQMRNDVTPPRRRQTLKSKPSCLRSPHRRAISEAAAPGRLPAPRRTLTRS